MDSSRTTALIDSFTTPRPDPWVALFEANVPWALKEGVLASGAVDLDGPATRATDLLDAYVRSHASQPGPTQVEPDCDDGPQALPETLSREWRNITGPAALAGRLVACGAHPFATPDRPGPDLLDVALRMNWGPMVLRLLAHQAVPAAVDLQARRSGLMLRTKPLPWAHTLAFRGHAKLLRAWLSQPGMDANALDDKGRTPLFYAKTPDVLRVLCAAGANPAWLAPDGRTARAHWEHTSDGAPLWSSGIQHALIEALEAEVGAAGNTHTASERINRWASAGPEDWESLPPSAQQELLGLRVQLKAVRPGGLALHWGALGYLASLITTGHAFFDRGDRCIQAWTSLGASVPQALLEHESSPGVADGWVVVAKLCRHVAAGLLHGSTNTTRTTAMAALDAWSQRLLRDVPKAQWPRVWRMSVLKAVGSLLDRTGNADRLTDIFDVLLDRTEFGARLGGPVADEVLREMAAFALVTPVLQPLVLCPVMAGFGSAPLVRVLEQPWMEGGPADAQWACLLAVYHRSARRLEKNKGALETAAQDDIVGAIEDVMDEWVSCGFLPQALQAPKVRRGLGVLSRRCPHIRGALSVCQLEQSVSPAASGSSRARARM